MKCVLRFLTAGFLLAGSHAYAQDNVQFGGQIRPRFEARDPGTAVGTSDSFISMRTRANLTASLERNVSVFIQIQDIRLWGDETHPAFDANADRFDLHQGYFDLTDFAGSPWSIRAGRQEIALGGERLIGPVGWLQQAQTFDGIRISTASDRGRLDFVGLRIAETTVGSAVALGRPGAGEENPAAVPPTGNANNATLFAVYGTIARMKDASLDLYGIYNESISVPDYDQITLGVRYAANRPVYEYRFEGSGQFGDRGGADISAFMFGARIGRKLGAKGKLTGWYDYLSGDDDATDGNTNVFDTIFATNHKFYGFFDLFTNIPLHTGGLGLQDLALKGSLTPRPAFTLGLDIHSFRTAKKGAQGSGHLGEEVDLTLTYRYAPGVALVGGFAYVFSDTALGAVRGVTEDASWGYLMTTVAF